MALSPGREGGGPHPLKNALGTYPSRRSSTICGSSRREGIHVIESGEKKTFNRRKGGAFFF